MLPSLKRTDPSNGLQRAPQRFQHRPYQQKQAVKTQEAASRRLPPEPGCPRTTSRAVTAC